MCALEEETSKYKDREVHIPASFHSTPTHCGIEVGLELLVPASNEEQKQGHHSWVAFLSTGQCPTPKPGLSARQRARTKTQRLVERNPDSRARNAKSKTKEVRDQERFLLMERICDFTKMPPPPPKSGTLFEEEDASKD